MMRRKDSFMTSLMRRKAVEEDHMTDTSLARVLGLVDLCCLAVGSTLGLGIYVLAGDVAKTEAGPAVVISFLVAAVASLFAALCYAEFAARVPKAGSAYVYSYVCVGEFVAFVIGWNLILEYVIGTASVARGYSTYVDSIFDQAMQKAFTKCCGMDVEFLSAYPDFFAFFLVMLLTLLLAIGVKESTRFNNVFTFANLVVVIYVIITGSFKADGANWRINPDDVPEWKDEYGTGGFMPFGISGVMAGAARCFYGFVGFDAVATTGEEAKNPQRTIPLAIIVGLTVIFLSYFGVSAVLTLMYPYYLQDEDAPIPAAFEALGWESARWIVTIGALFGLSSSLLGALFPLPRILYAMANDGLIFRWMANIHPRFQTPFWSTLLAGVFAAAMASFFDLEQLVDMMSIGTLLAYSLVAVCVLVLRYEPSPAEERLLRLRDSVYRDESLGLVDHEAELADGTTLPTDASATLPTAASTDLLLAAPGKDTGLVSRLLNLSRLQSPSHQSAQLVNHVTVVYGIITVSFCAVLVFAAEPLTGGEAWAIVLAAVLGAAMVVCVIIVQRQPESKAHLFFRVPLVPYLPMLSVFVNVYLMMKLGPATWIRFGIWMILGLLMYFLYGMKNSSAGTGARVKKRPADLALDQLELPTIVIEPATPLQRSPNMAGRPAERADEELSDGTGSEPSEPTAPEVSELIVETAPEPELEKQCRQEADAVGWKAERETGELAPSESSPGDAMDQERTVLAVTQTVQRQKGLHAAIIAALRPGGGDSGRGRQLALTQQQREAARLEEGYEPPRRPAAPADAKVTEEMVRTAERQAVLHAAVARSLGAPADGAPAPIRVSAEVHSEAPERELQEAADRLAALLAGGPPDPLRRDGLLKEHWRKHEAGGGEPAPLPGKSEAAEGGHGPPPLPDGLAEETQRIHEAVVEQLAAGKEVPASPPAAAEALALHAAVCECFSGGWVDLGRGAALADQQRAREAERGPTPPPPTSPPPQPAAAGDPLTAEHKQRLDKLHTAIYNCLSSVPTPPNTPTGGPRPPLSPLALGSTQRPRLQRVLSKSSFQSIPPQSPDSPLARRVGDKFVIIPVSGDDDSEREDEPPEKAVDEEVRRAMQTVQDEVLKAMARATDGDDDREEEQGSKETEEKEEDSEEIEEKGEGSTGGEEGKPQLGEAEGKEPPADAPSSEVRRGMDAVLGEVLAAAPPAPEEDHHSVSSDEPADVGTPGGSSGNISGDERSTQPTPETRRAMNSVLSEMTAAAGAGKPEQTGPRVGGGSKRNQVAAPPEQNMKEALDQIIKQAVEKAAKRVAEAPSEGEESDVPTSAPPPPPPPPPPAPKDPESTPAVDNIGNGMHRIRSKKSKQTPAFDMNELMSRFEKKDS